ncbi:MAG: hypothetical protein F6K09_00475 [Merismopedia sp. SIO2A8]|nr:hypothetical protein [Symploca sp. SIO2B6]NET47242.1 hypothetical protein [Merismopedia sp. SIO2A8]
MAIICFVKYRWANQDSQTDLPEGDRQIRYIYKATFRGCSKLGMYRIYILDIDLNIDKISINFLDIF